MSVAFVAPAQHSQFFIRNDGATPEFRLRRRGRSPLAHGLRERGRRQRSWALPLSPPVPSSSWDRGLRSLRTRRPPYHLDSRHCTGSEKAANKRSPTSNARPQPKAASPASATSSCRRGSHARLLRAAKCGSGAGNRVGPMSRWQEFKMLLLAFAISVGLIAAGALLAIGMAHL